MLIVVPVSHTDKELIDCFTRVFNLLGPYENHRLLVVSRPNDFYWGRKVFREIKDNGFKSAEYFVFDENGPPGWPRGCNHYWWETVNYLENVQGIYEPWLWMELDMTPIRYGWVDALQQEYKAAGKPFMGNLAWTTTTTCKGKIVNLCKHLVGAAIHPPGIDNYSNIWKHVNELPTAWDILCQFEFAPLTNDTKLMQHCFRTNNYRKTYDEAGRMVIQGDDTNNFPDGLVYNDPIDMDRTVLVHGCVDDSLPNLICDLYSND